MAEQYSLFSTVYDMFMDNVPYIEWADGIEQTLKKHGINEGIVLDLGCGTGTLTKMLADKGYDMIGIDGSEEMLLIAREKDENTLFLCQDISEFELYGTVRAVISTCDTLNYILDEEELINTFKLVNNYLEPGGIFVFDMNAPEKYEEVLSDNVFAENRDEASFIWDNFYDEDEHINEYVLTLFMRDDKSGLYKKHEEYHYQRNYLRDEIKELLDRAGLEIIENFEKDLRMYYTVKVKEGCKLGNIG